MPSSPSRRAAPRRSPRAAPLSSTRAAAVPAGRPLSAPSAAVFGVLTAAEGGYLASLLWPPEPGGDWAVATPAALAVLALAGSVLVLLGRGRGWLVLAVAAALSALLLLGVALLFGALGDGSSVGWSLLMLVGPVGALVLAVRRPIREWTRPGRGTPPPVPARPDRAPARGR
jgi:hypothetical protein